MPTTTRTISGWGRYPRVTGRVAAPDRPDAVSEAVGPTPGVIARGNGRSYGDASLGGMSTVDMRGLDRMVAFDGSAGVLTCEAGVTLRDVVRTFVPRGWFPPVVPGTSLVTVGGMVASDVHGKNHHLSGSFSNHVEALDILLEDGAVRTCSPDQDADLFWATCGGMGLTGVVTRVRFRMRPIETALIRQTTERARDLAEAVSRLDAASGSTYSVAWIDCVATGRQLGRSVVISGEHATLGDLPPAARADPLRLRPRRARRVPVDFPGAALNRWSVGAFNALYYGTHGPSVKLVGFDPFFFPLDTLGDWNRIYGARGFVQFQGVVPVEGGLEALRRLLDTISASGAASFLSVLKRLGPEGQGPLSFPRDGYTLALDLAWSDAIPELYGRLQAITLESGGRLYLAKDALATPEMLLRGYPRLPAFRDALRRWAPGGRFASHLSHRLGLS